MDGDIAVGPHARDDALVFRFLATKINMVPESNEDTKQTDAALFLRIGAVDAGSWQPMKIQRPKQLRMKNKADRMSLRCSDHHMVVQQRLIFLKIYYILTNFACRFRFNGKS